MEEIWREPVRGGFADPALFSLPGLEQVRAMLRGQVPMHPVNHLTGTLPVQAAAGTATVSMPATAWLSWPNGWIDFHLMLEVALILTAMTSLPPATKGMPKVLSVKYLRPLTVDSEQVTARGRVVTTGRAHTLADALVEDARGRSVAHATMLSENIPINPPPPVRPLPEEPLTRPSYPTPDPWRRPLPQGEVTTRFRPGLTGAQLLSQLAERPPSPISLLTGISPEEFGADRATFSMPMSEWMGNMYRRLGSGPLAMLASAAAQTITLAQCPPGRAFVVLGQEFSFSTDVPADGRLARATAMPAFRAGDMMVTRTEVFDPDGIQIGLAQSTNRFVDLGPRGARREPERALATVMFTDIVGSTRRAAELGDARWAQLLAEHHAIARREIGRFRGREIKTTGDGFLATFDIPARAAECARAIRDAVRGIGLEIRAGMHTGEVEVVGADVGGIAVHVASRIEAAAAPGEVWVSSTVRDLSAGSGLRFADRGGHELKGVEEAMRLYAVEG